jgi:hypothetical protein
MEYVEAPRRSAVTGGVGFEPSTRWRYHPKSLFFLLIMKEKAYAGVSRTKAPSISYAFTFDSSRFFFYKLYGRIAAI